MCAGALDGMFIGIKKPTEYGDTTATKVHLYYCASLCGYQRYIYISECRSTRLCW